MTEMQVNSEWTNVAIAERVWDREVVRDTAGQGQTIETLEGESQGYLG